MKAVELIKVSKKYRRLSERTRVTTLKSFILREFWKGHNRNNSCLWALKDVSFAINEGGAFAIIGKNGSGKSTLLKIIAGILRPDEGSLKIHGKVAALIELGAGFHPELSGRENIFINGILLGLSKWEVKRRMDEIIEFSELRDCIDEPVRTYSSGMYMRLGFSVAVHVDPDILLVDEVLSVGDTAFTRKCMERMNYFKRSGKTIVVVTHDLQMVKTWCEQAAWLDSGRLREIGDAMKVTDHYEKDAARHPNRGAQLGKDGLAPIK